MAKKVRVARTHISDKKKRNEKKKGKKREKKQYIRYLFGLDSK